MMKFVSTKSEIKGRLEYKMVGEEEGHYAYHEKHKDDHINPKVSLSNNGNRMVPESSYEHLDYLDVEAKVYQITDKVYCFSGFSLANTVVIEGEDGLIVVDVNYDMHTGDMINAALRDITDKPVKAILYSHNHLDHIGGGRAFVTDKQIENNEVEIIAHRKFMDNVRNIFSVITPILAQRSLYHLGEYLEWNEVSGRDDGYVHGGIGIPTSGRYEAGEQQVISFIPPTIIVPDEGLELEIAGIPLEIMYAPSETEDELVIYLPQEKILITSEVINPTFPNLYTPRGTDTRNVGQWINMIDEMRYRFFDAEYMLPTHGRPVYGKDKVRKRMTDYRDAICWVYQQTIRGMNQGLNRDELVEYVNLPERLNSCWDHGLGNHYGHYDLCVKAIYTDFLGWYQGDPAELLRAPYKTRAKNYVELIGGLEKIKKETRTAIDRKEYAWAAELISWAVRAYPDDREAKLLKAEALEEMGYLTIAANLRGFYLTAAKELRGVLNKNIEDPNLGDVLRELDFSTITKMITIRWDASKAENDNVEMGLAFVLKEENEEKNKVVILARGGAIEFVEEKHVDLLPAKAIGATVVITKDSLIKILLKQTTVQEELLANNLTISNIMEMQKFMSYFEFGTFYREIKIADR